MNKKKFINTKNTLNENYREILKNISRDNVCPFCEENLPKYHPKKILFKTDYWIVTTNAWPYSGTKHHFLLIYKKHITHLKKIPQRATTDMLEITKGLTAQYKIEGGSLLMRFGKSESTGASVEHLHAHLISPDRQNKNYDPKKGIIARIG